MDRKQKGKCIDYAHDGRGVIKIKGIPIFVENLLVGEEADILITKREKGYSLGRRLELLTVSSKRCKPICEKYKECGGCQLQHMTYDEQLKFKKDRVKAALKRIGKLDVDVQDVIGMKDPYKYRNKVQVPFGKDDSGNIIAGFYKKGTHNIINMDKCYIEDKDADDIVVSLKHIFTKYSIEPYNVEEDKGIVRAVLVRKSITNKELMVVIITRSMSLLKSKEIVRDLLQAHKNIKTIVHNINNKRTTVMLGSKEEILYGEGYIEDYILGVKFKISSKSFYQINPIQTEVLYKKAIELANLKKDDVVLDAYCGVGTIGLIVSSKVKSVVGVEISNSAIEDAKYNASINKIKNAEFVVGDAKEFIKKEVKNNKKYDVVFVDPPRDGCDKEFIGSLVKMLPPRIIYISCDPSSLSRDLLELSKYYDVSYCQPVDMFPQTYHVESVVALVRKEIDI